ncbi:hypothetical protein O6H91_13G096200 [Diphasiastrum complanatum]|uniref:Uncharacterized protein n=2 Tax=Diphasiastrum complanatum TaxID=34168 RepID=A0ACC2BXI4_DIPCM|nr:hypothetical protein O6H91_13G096200 [Diphasiastrum complanatum]KAJ7534465.1 hypothetical protein O6H91_13G096200 [Diphasiastrum complanatum]
MNATGKDREEKALQFLEDVTVNAAAVQQSVLCGILERNGQTEYLKRHGLDGRTDRESFKQCIPVITYEDLEPDIQRIASGDTSPILSAHPISEFLTSSGTSGGQRKLMPTIAEELERKSLLYSLLMPVMNQYISDLDKGKGMYLLFIKHDSKTPGGLFARPVLTSYYKSRYFQDRSYDPWNVYTSPTDTILCVDAYQSMYCQLLCGLLQKSEVLRMGAVFASGFLRAIRFLEQHWPEICQDIRLGQLNERITDFAARKSVMQLLQPSPQLADSIQEECCKASWQGILPRLWPNTKYLDVIVTGSMAQYIPTLDFYSGGLPLVCTMYASSECYFGINLEPLCPPSDVSYTLLPNMAYFEFMPMDDRHNSSEQNSCMKLCDDQSQCVAKPEILVDLVDVEIGKEYELVISTYAGMYRYRVGDILRVTGFYNSAPQFAFVCRKNAILSIDADKTGEQDLQTAVTNATKILKNRFARLKEYTSYADTAKIPGHYVLFWELETTQPLEAWIMEECCLAVEESLDSVYRQCRVADKSIGPLEIRVVSAGTFDQLMDYALSRGASINQYKAPRCIKSTAIIDLLNARVVQSYFSPRFPHWSVVRPEWAFKAHANVKNHQPLLMTVSNEIQASS